MVALMIPLAASDYWHASIPDWYQPFAGGAGTVATGGLINRWRDVRPGYDFRVLFRFGRLIRSAAKRLHGNRRAHQLR